MSVTQLRFTRDLVFTDGTHEGRPAADCWELLINEMREGNITKVKLGMVPVKFTKDFFASISAPSNKVTTLSLGILNKKKCDVFCANMMSVNCKVTHLTLIGDQQMDVFGNLFSFLGCGKSSVKTLVVDRGNNGNRSWMPPPELYSMIANPRSSIRNLNLLVGWLDFVEEDEISQRMDSPTCKLSNINFPTISQDMRKQIRGFNAVQKNRAALMALASAHSIHRVGALSAARFFPCDLQRLLKTFL